MIIFQTLSWKNFLSTGNNKTIVDLTRYDTTLVSGENGAGKSTMLDALTFALFGKSFRGINIPQLPNSINERDCEVEIEFIVGQKEYRVVRGIKPKKFEIYKDGALLPQDSRAKDYQRILEEQILKMTYKSFCQVVILGSSNYIPFMKLTAADRRSVVENLLDIDVFSVMNTIVRGKIQVAKEYIKDLDHKIEIAKSKIDEKQKLIDTLNKKSSESVEKYKAEITESQKQIDEIQKQIDNYRHEVGELLKQVTDKDKVPNKLLELESIERQQKTNIKNIDTNIRFYEENDTCPSCKQDIEQHHKECVFEEKNKERDKAEIKLKSVVENVEEIENRLTIINGILDNIQTIEKEISGNQNQISASVKYIDKVRQNIESVSGEGTEIQETKKELNELMGEGKQCVGKRKELVEDQHYFKIASLLLKDSGIKSKIIKRYLPIMNKLINKYLADMDFFCQFNLDENFNETIKSRHRDEFTYHSFSEGERLRIDLSLLLAWREIARLKNSVNCNSCSGVIRLDTFRATVA